MTVELSRVEEVAALLERIASFNFGDGRPAKQQACLDAAAMLRLQRDLLERAVSAGEKLAQQNEEWRNLVDELRARDK